MLKGLPRVPFVNCRQFMYLVISLLVLRAGYGIWLYQFLIIAYLFTLLLEFAELSRFVNFRGKYFLVFKLVEVLPYCNDPKFSGRQDWANSGAVWSESTLFLGIFCMHFSMVKPPCSDFRVITCTVMILSFRTAMPGQTVQTQIRLLLEEQSDQGLHCLLFRLQHLDSLLYGRAT